LYGKSDMLLQPFAMQERESRERRNKSFFQVKEKNVEERETLLKK